MLAIEAKFGVVAADFQPLVYWRVTDNWVELTVRFLTRDRGIRNIKDAMAREVLAKLAQGGIGIPSPTFEITALPPLQATLSRSSRAT